MATFSGFEHTASFVDSDFTGSTILNHEATLTSGSTLGFVQILRAKSGSAVFYFNSENPIQGDFEQIVVVDSFLSGQKSFTNNQ